MVGQIFSRIGKSNSYSNICKILYYFIVIFLLLTMANIVNIPSGITPGSSKTSIYSKTSFNPISDSTGLSNFEQISWHEVFLFCFPTFCYIFYEVVRLMEWGRFLKMMMNYRRSLILQNCINSIILQIFFVFCSFFYINCNIAGLRLHQIRILHFRYPIPTQVFLKLSPVW